jgi:hypothetical protein
MRAASGGKVEPSDTRSKREYFHSTRVKPQASAKISEPLRSTPYDLSLV